MIQMEQLTNFLNKITEWVFQWKMNLSLDPSKQTQKFILTGKVKKAAHAPIFFNYKPVQQFYPQKDLGLLLDIYLTFDEHIKAIKSKVSKTIGLLRNVNNGLALSSHTTSYKPIMRPNLDYSDVIVDKASNNSF